MSVLTSRFASPCALRFSHRHGARLRQRGWRSNPASGSRRHGTEGERKAETQARTGACRSASSAACASTGGASCTAGQSGRRDNEHPQPGPQHHLRADRDGADHDQPQHYRGAAAGREPNGREDRAAVSRSYAGFRRQRQFPCAQRARQCAGSHQRHHASGRRQRLRHVPRYCVDRQHLADHRRATAAIWPAHLRRPRHPDAQRRLQQYGTVGIYGGSAETFTPSFEYGGPSDRRSTFSLAASSRAISAWKTRRRTGMPSTTTRRRSAASATSRPCSTPTRGSPSSPAPLTRVSDSRHPRPDVELHRLRRLQLQFGPAQREPARAELLWLRRGNARSTAPTCNCPISRATAAFTSFPTRSAISSSMAWRPKSFAPILPTASPATSPIASTRRTHCAAAFCCAPTRRT